MKSKIWIALTFLVVASLACSFGGDGQDTGGSGGETGGGGAEATAAPGGGGGGAPEAPQLDSDALDQLDSYRGRMTIRLTPSGGATEVTEMLIEETRDPLAQRYVFVIEGTETEFVRIGDMAWICSQGSCMQSQMSEEELDSGFGESLMYDPEELSDMVEGSDYEYIGEETINGIRADHYVITLSATELALPSQGQLSEVEANVWIADESDLPAFAVRMEMRWEGAIDDAQGETEYIYEIYEVNTSFTIEPPEGAGAGFPVDVPEYPGATDLAMMGGLITFSTSDAVDTVADFYRSELAGLGWSLESDEQMGIITQVWNKEGRQLSVLITSDGTGSSVLITLEE